MSEQTGPDFEQLLLGLVTPRQANDLLLAPASRRRLPPRPHEYAQPLYSHVSEGIELAYVVRGATRVVTPEAVFHLTPSKLLVVDRGVYHAELPAGRSRGHRIFWCHLTQTRGRLVETVHAPSRPLSSTDVNLPGRTDIERLGDTIVTELSARHWGYQQAVAGLLNYLVCILVRRVHRGIAVPSARVEPPSISGDPRLWEVIEAALGVCEANFRSGISRADVARAVGYSPGHLGHVFSSYLGHSLSDHLRNLRIREGRHLLETTSLTIGEIAQAVGYADPAHFTRAFQRITGTSPTEFRRHAEGP